MDPYYKKNITFQLKDHDLDFRVSQSLFSSQSIDLGTRHLIKTLLDANLQSSRKILDVGCGYGPIGIALKSINPFSDVSMVDRDALALSYTRQNIGINNLRDINVYASLGYDEVQENDFDLIVSNIPAKVGDKVLTHILKDSRFHLKPGGKMAIVVIDAIGDYVTQELNDQEIHISFAKRWPGYLVFHYDFGTNLVSGRISESFKSGIYNRNQQQIFYHGLNFSMKTIYNLPEFDTMSYDTDILLNCLKIFKPRKLNFALVFNPGQGYIPTALSKFTEVKKMYLIDRDLQALKISGENLIVNGYPSGNISVSHQVGITVAGGVSFDCILGILNEDDNPEVQIMLLNEAADQISINGFLILAAGSTIITRLEYYLRQQKLLQIVDRKRSKGRSVLVLKGKT